MHCTGAQGYEEACENNLGGNIILGIKVLCEKVKLINVHKIGIKIYYYFFVLYRKYPYYK